MNESINHSFTLHIPDNMPEDVVHNYLKRVSKEYDRAFIKDTVLPNGRKAKELSIFLFHSPSLVSGPYYINHKLRTLQALTSALVEHTQGDPIDIRHRDHTGRVTVIKASPIAMAREIAREPTLSYLTHTYRDMIKYLRDPEGKQAKLLEHQVRTDWNNPQTRLKKALADM